MTIAEDMLAKAGVKTEQQPANPAEGAGAAINSEGAAGGGEGGDGKPANPGAAAPVTPAAGAAGAGAAAAEGADGEKKTEPLDPAKDGTVTVTDLNPPADPAKTTEGGSSSATPTGTDPAAPVETGADFEAKVLEYLAQKSGKEVKSIDEFLAPAKRPEEMTDEEKVKAQEKFNNDAVRYALDKQLFTPKDLEAYNVDKARSHREIALRVFADETLAMDPVLAEAYKTDKAGTLEKIEERFQEAFFEHEEEDDWRRIRGEASMKNIAEGYINHKYGSVLDATEAFKDELDTQQSAVVYHGRVEKVFSELPQHLKIKIEDKEYSYQIPETTRAILKEQFLKPETFAKLRDDEEADLRSTVNNAVFFKEQNKFITEVCKAYASTLVAAIKMGRKDIPVTTDPSGTSHAPTTTGGKTQAEVMLEKAMAKKSPFATAKP